MRVVAAARRFKGVGAQKDVFVCPDRTLCERQLDKQLREERDSRNRAIEGTDEGRHFRFVIRDGEVKRLRRYDDRTTKKTN